MDIKEVITVYDTDDYKNASYVRTTVFIEEQGFAYEFDETDYTADHAVIYINGEPAAAGRVFSEEGHEDMHIGRVCVMKKFRGTGIGARVMSVLEKVAAEKGATGVFLSAQLTAAGFYERLGYEQYGDVYPDEGVPHIAMKKKFQ
ncbi:MAG: GNAT family N-acetyltransferase [Oscillospiraceae bacterium]|nr:GNAT family N-acetyltransferase [Oscillospiraceae bacterium]